MYDYKFIKLDYQAFWKTKKVDYQAIIKEHAKDGWRLVQIFTPPSGMNESLNYIELILEKEIE